MNIDHDHPVTADPVHTPWCERAHPDTDDGTGATPCTSRPVMLWPGAAGWLRSATYPADAPVVIVDNRDGTQSTWALAEFRQMLWAGLELCATANLGTWPAPDPGPAPHTELMQAAIEAQADAYARNTISPELADALLNRPPRARPRVDLRLRLDDPTARQVMADTGVPAEIARILRAIPADVIELAEQAIAAIPTTVPTMDGLEQSAGMLDAPAVGITPATPDSVDRAHRGIRPVGLCTCSFLPDPHIWGAACPAPPAGGQA